MNKLLIGEVNSEVVPANKMIRVSNDGVGVCDEDGLDLIQSRACGEFADKALYLSDKYDWKMGVDSLGAVVLVPVKKEV